MKRHSLLPDDLEFELIPHFRAYAHAERKNELQTVKDGEADLSPFVWTLLHRRLEVRINTILFLRFIDLYIYYSFP